MKSNHHNCCGLQLVLLICCFLPGVLPAQEQMLEGKPLNEVEIFAEAYPAITVDVCNLEADSLKQLGTLPLSLSDLLQDYTGIAFKQYGVGMTSTISFRGSGASQTAVLWNGVNINSPTLGSTDFSNIPVFLLDEVSVQSGAPAALYGTDAIGGTIQLNSTPVFDEGTKIQLVQEAGSFGHVLSGSRLQFSNGKWFSRTAIFYQQAENDFPFTNTARFGFPEERQQNASVQQYGMTQDVAYQFKPGQQAGVRLWYNRSNDEVQPTLAANFNPSQYTFLEDEALRAMIYYEQAGKKGVLSVQSTFLADWQNFNNQSHTNAYRFVQQVSYSPNLSNQLQLKAGVRQEHVQPQVDNYNNSIWQNRWEAFLFTRWDASARLALSANLRGVQVNGFEPVLAPSLAGVFTLLNNEKESLEFRASGAWNYRIPNLNDLYWEPGGNPELQPERGLSTEAGFTYTRQTTGRNIDISVTGYFQNIQDWIIWLDRGAFWSPENIRQVHSRGIEVNGDYREKLGAVTLQNHLSYTLAKATNQQPVSASDNSVGNQLPYTPVHRAALVSQLIWKLNRAGLTLNYTGLRYITTAGISSLPAYFLAGFQAGRRFNFGFAPVIVQLQINNILNTAYESVNNRAMPGRNYRIQLNINF